jgi:DNA-binding MarR family transcriptional regulator
MYLPTDDDVDTLCAWYRNGYGEPAWVSGDLTLAAGFRITIYFMQRCDLSLTQLARDLGVPRKNLDHAIEELTGIVSSMSEYGRVYSRRNMTDSRFRAAAKQANRALAAEIERDYA